MSTVVSAIAPAAPPRPRVSLEESVASGVSMRRPAPVPAGPERRSTQPQTAPQQADASAAAQNATPLGTNAHVGDANASAGPATQGGHQSVPRTECTQQLANVLAAIGVLLAIIYGTYQSVYAMLSYKVSKAQYDLSVLDYCMQYDEHASLSGCKAIFAAKLLGDKAQHIGNITRRGIETIGGVAVTKISAAKDDFRMFCGFMNPILKPKAGSPAAVIFFAVKKYFGTAGYAIAVQFLVQTFPRDFLISKFTSKKFRDRKCFRIAAKVFVCVFIAISGYAIGTNAAIIATGHRRFFEFIFLPLCCIRLLPTWRDAVTLYAIFEVAVIGITISSNSFVGTMLFFLLYDYVCLFRILEDLFRAKTRFFPAHAGFGGSLEERKLHNIFSVSKCRRDLRLVVLVKLLAIGWVLPPSFSYPLHACLNSPIFEIAAQHIQRCTKKNCNIGCTFSGWYYHSSWGIDVLWCTLYLSLDNPAAQLVLTLLRTMPATSQLALILLEKDEDDKKKKKRQ